jgi:antitoxin VapB
MSDSGRGKRLAKAKSYRAKLFRNGGSQAVRLPKECRLAGSEVLIRREGQQLIIEPIDKGWSEKFLATFLGPPDATMPQREQGAQRDREKLK